jgi:hypothetical protein
MHNIRNALLQYVILHLVHNFLSGCRWQTLILGGRNRTYDKPVWKEIPRQMDYQHNDCKEAYHISQSAEIVLS